ncbi:hypothetical protein HAX54_003872 [Datura stramonium]|uniref:Glycosyl transferase 48 domain-containing protein n=1 Tax=Datura stramonium TaxID=4076 RepID=A0ABS8T792_DATST|nr:hypothetical protein [Datura stramonium]
MAFSVLTPYYNEEVLYNKEQLRTENEDGISTLYYLQTIYADEWENFLQRMRREGMVDEKKEGQTLTRTVRGMMYYYRALKMLAFLDSASEMDIREGSVELGSMRHDGSIDGLSSERSQSSRRLSRADSSVSLLFKGHEYGTALMKFTYVVACQIYGTQKAKKDPHAEEILYLMKNNEALRVAYVDEVPTEVDYSDLLFCACELFLSLPRGDAVQTIDMNQDNYFEEALKMRNLLEEFKRYYGIRKPSILEFGTYIYRFCVIPVLVSTKCITSKASRVINISEDIFAGFNCTLRGGNVTHHEYMLSWQRKGWLNQISVFEPRLPVEMVNKFLAEMSIATLFTALPMIVENSLEHGFTSIWEFLNNDASTFICILKHILNGNSCSLLWSYYSSWWQNTGNWARFVVQHKSFAENYRLYARSHFVKAIELGLILTVYAAYSPVAKGTFTYIALTISSLAPCFAKAEQSWEKWWEEEQDHLRTTGLWGKIVEIILDLRFFFFQYGIVYQLGIAARSKSIAVYLLSWIYVVVALGFFNITAYAREKYAAREHIYFRLVQLLVVVFFIVVIVALLQFTAFRFGDLFISLLAFVPTGWGFISVAQVLRPFLQNTMIWGTIVSVARLYETMFGIIVMVPVAVLSWLPGFQPMQTRILFNEAFSRGLRIFQIVTGKKPKSDV